jgi:hypothetical protein
VTFFKIGIFLFSFTVCAAEPAAVFKSFRQRFRSPECQARFNDLSEFKILFALPEFSAFLEDRKKMAPLKKLLEGWSTDLLLKLVLEVEQELYAVCPYDSHLDLLLTELKRLSLSRLDLDSAKLSAKEIDSLFRGTIALKDDREKIKKRVGELKKIGVPPGKTLEMLYGSAHEVWGVKVLSPKDFSVKNLQVRLKEICPKEKNCAFWNSRAIYKVIVVSESGLAGYVPEIGVLIFSQDLLDNNLLHQIVFFHELVHVAEKTVWLEDREDWKKEFAVFSGWEQSEEGQWQAKATKSEKERKDKLTELSAGSAYSFLPDNIYLVTGSKDGFALGKAYTESALHGPSEDLADHMALYKYFPERFCLDGKNVAPQKFAWLQKPKGARHLLGGVRHVNCK